MESIISRWRPQSPEAALRERNQFVESLKGLPIAEQHQGIVERNFRKPIVIFNALAVRPFWRDGRKAPPLPWVDNNGKIIKEHKASSRIVRGH